MSGITPEQEKLVDEAAGIYKAGNGKIKIVDAMKLVGFSQSDTRKMTLYQKVRRRAMKLAIVKTGATPTDPPAPPPVSVNLSSSSSNVSVLTNPEGLNSNNENNLTRRSVPSVHEPHSVRRRVFGTPSTNSKSPDKVPTKKNNRRTSKECHKHHARVAVQTARDKEALKQATTLIHRNRGLPKKHPARKTIEAIVTETNQQMSSNVSPKTAADYVRKGLIGVSPLKRGPVGPFPPRIYRCLKGAFVTYLKLEQAGSRKQSTTKKMSQLVNACVNKAGHNKSRDDLARKMKRETANEFNLGKANVIEQRRIQWTTSYNLDIWFDTWKEMLVELGFAKERMPNDPQGEGELVFYAGQLERIINLDETDGSLDDTTGQRGGRPAMTFHAPDVAGGGTAVNKSGYSSTIICGSNAKGEPLPPHFQLKTLAQTEEKQRISVDWIANSKNVVAKFGFDQRSRLPCTYGMNKKAGMNAVELNKYFNKAILPLYPDLEDRPGKRIIVKVDSGPGRMNIEMLADLMLQGVYLVPGVPNTTHKTQEMDQNYGVFKSSYRDNLRALSQARFDRGFTLKVADLPLLVFGGTCPATGVVLRDSFSASFSIEHNLSCWRQCGAVPLTRSVLYDKAVRREVASGRAAELAKEEEKSDPEVLKLKQLESLNGFYCDVLCSNGMDGDQLHLQAPQRVTYVAVTEPHSQERMHAIKKAKTAGQMFFATGGRHLNSDEFFRAKALAERDQQIAALEKKKLEQTKNITEQREAVMLIRKKGELTTLNEKQFTLAEVKTLLKYRKGGPKPVSNKKSDLVDAYIQAPKRKPTKVWSRGEEAALVELKREDIDLKDTALGVAASQMSRAVVANLDKLTDETRAALKRSLEEFEDGTSHGVI